MPLTLVIGPANSAKAGEVLGAYADAAHRGALLVVPTALDARHYARELACDRAVLGTVLTFSGLAREIARRTDYAGRRLTALQREQLIRRVVTGARLSLLSESAGARGFATAAGELIAELERSLVTPGRFAKALAAWAAQDPRRRRYANDLAALYDGYAASLARLGRVDAELHAWRALDALRAAPARWGSDSVFFYGFDDLTPLERDAIETLARQVGVEVTVSLNYEPGHAGLTARAEVVEELRTLAERVLELPALGDHYEAPVLHHLERGLFGAGGEQVDPGDVVLLLESGGERAQAELIAGEVLGLLAQGFPADEIVVVYRRPERAAPVLEAVFAEYGIPLAGERRIPVTHTPLGRSLRALARCAFGRGTPADLVDYLRAPGLLDQAAVADRLEAAIRREGITSVADARARMGWELGELDLLGDSGDPLAGLVAQAQRVFALPHRGQAPALNPSEELDARALAALARAAAELAEVGMAPTADELLELLEEIDVPVGEPVRPGAVLLADPLAIRARRFQAVFAAGLQEGEFPLPGVPEPFLSDELRHELAACAGLRLRPREDALDRERYLFYACVSRTTRRLALSYRSSDEEGNLALASPFIADVAELLSAEWTSRRRRRLLADVVWPVSAAPTTREVERARAAALAPAPGAADGLDRPAYQLSELALSHARHSEIVSGGALESFASCPVKWLVERELQPERFDPEPEPLARGNHMHAVLEALLRRLGGPLSEATLPNALQLLGEVIAELPAPIAAGRGQGARAAELARIEADLRRYLAQEAGGGCGYQPDGLELRFGFDDEPESLPALELAGDVRLRGMIDRIDVDGAGHAIVRDYKSGSVRPEQAAARWAQDGQLQVALYMLAVRELLGLEPVAGLYQPLSGGDLRPRGVYRQGAAVGDGVVGTDARDQGAFEAVLDDARARAVALAARLRAGELVPCPERCSRDGCRYPGICRV